MSRHFIIPDTQDRPDVPKDHLEWVGQAIVEYKPDTVIHIGDHWDMPSLSMHDGAGSMKMEGARYTDDINSGNDAFAALCKPMEDEQARLRRNKEKQWKPRKVFLFGNHENRINRAVNANPKYAGALGEHHCNTRDWERHKFLGRVHIDGIVYSHFFQSQFSSHAIGGTIDNRLNKIGQSFVQGHQQGFLYSSREMANGSNRHGLVAGSCYLHDEEYRGEQGQGHWRGVVVLNEVRNGDYCVMPLTLDYLCRKYEGMSLAKYLRKKYKDAKYKFWLARDENL